MLKSKLMPTVVLSAICLYAVAILAVVNIFTAPAIKKNQEEKTRQALLEVMPDGGSFEKIDDISGLPEEIVEAYASQNGGYVFKMEVKGYKTGLVVICGVDQNGNITGTKHIESSETLGAESKIAGSFVGKNILNYSSVDTITGATLTCNGYKQAIGAALQAHEIMTGGGK